ncbi:MAG: AmmeMemoRadiSam system protein A [Spirochaetales bacterium]|nr:AmmeMemoRadiSam system protein A [Spirochaetales bacterium]
MDEPIMLSEQEQREMLELARESIRRRFHHLPVPSVTAAETSILQKPLGAFVTLHKGHELRGCIGRILTSDPLYVSLPILARESAFEDRRFQPLSMKELDFVQIEISILSQPHEITDISEIKTGTHGIIVTYSGHKAVFLPQVAVEQKWNTETYVSNCCRKAGLDPLSWQDHPVRIEVFTAFVCSE